MSNLLADPTKITEPELVAAVLAAPDDDLPRLVYADWLEEHAGSTKKARRFHLAGCECVEYDDVPNGRHERAEFIRVQVELAKWRRDDAEVSLSHEGIARHSILQQRERELWGDPNDRAKMLGLSPGWLATIVPENLERLSAGWVGNVLVRRGFVEAVRCPAAAWLEHGDKLYWRPGQTVECPECKGLGQYHYEEGNAASYDSTCPACDNNGRVPRPCPPTAQPVTRVRLTDWPDEASGFLARDGGRSCKSRLEARWPGVTFELPEDRVDLAYRPARGIVLPVRDPR